MYDLGAHECAVMSQMETARVITACGKHVSPTCPERALVGSRGGLPRAWPGGGRRRARGRGSRQPSRRRGRRRRAGSSAGRSSPWGTWGCARAQGDARGSPWLLLAEPLRDLSSSKGRGAWGASSLERGMAGRRPFERAQPTSPRLPAAISQAHRRQHPRRGCGTGATRVGAILPCGPGAGCGEDTSFMAGVPQEEIGDDGAFVFAGRRGRRRPGFRDGVALGACG